jgi:membrane protein required for colicin V production
VGILFAYLLSEYVFQYFIIYFESAYFELKIISYVVVFFLTILLINALASILTRVLTIVALNGVNRILGAILGGAKWLLVISVAIFFLNRAQKNSQILPKSAINESKYFRMISEYGEDVASALNFDNLLNKQYLIKDDD